MKILLLGAIVMLSFTRCNGIFSGIYDEVDEKSPYGFIEVDDIARTGRIYIDASDYTTWTYIDLDAKTTQTVDIVPCDSVKPDSLAPKYWSLAVHRYDTKTNNGQVMETIYDSFANLLSANCLPDADFVPDRQGRVVVDKSGMMEGKMLYTSTFVNTELNKWLAMDKSVMPPLYTLSNRVYLLKLNDGRLAALKFINFMDSANKKGFITIDYMFPVNF